MKQKGKWRQQLSASLTMDSESQPLQPILELCGERRVLIENHCGVQEYGTERISVGVRYGRIEIIGRGLRLCRMQGAQLVIIGGIDGINLVRRNA